MSNTLGAPAGAAGTEGKCFQRAPVEGGGNADLFCAIAQSAGASVASALNDNAARRSARDLDMLPPF